MESWLYVDSSSWMPAYTDRRSTLQEYYFRELPDYLPGWKKPYFGFAYFTCPFKHFQNQELREITMTIFTMWDSPENSPIDIPKLICAQRHPALASIRPNVIPHRFGPVHRRLFDRRSSTASRLRRARFSVVDLGLRSFSVVDPWSTKQ